MVEQNHNLIYGYLHAKDLDIDDWYDIAAIGLCKAAYYFKESEGICFSTFAYKVMGTFIANEFRNIYTEKRIPLDKTLFLDAEIAISTEGSTGSFADLIPSNDHVEDEAIAKCDYEKFLNKIPAKRRQVLQMYEAGLNTSQIAAYFGDSTVNIRRIRNELKKEYRKKVLM